MHLIFKFLISNFQPVALLSINKTKITVGNNYLEGMIRFAAMIWGIKYLLGTGYRIDFQRCHHSWTRSIDSSTLINKSALKYIPEKKYVHSDLKQPSVDCVTDGWLLQNGFESNWILAPFPPTVQVFCSMKPRTWSTS